MLIQKLRLQKGWSQEQLAELSGVSVRTIQRLERGQAGSLESLKALAAVFEIDFNRLKEPAMDTPAANPADAPIHQTASTDGMSQAEILALAHVRKVKGFYMQVLYYLVTIAFLAAINLTTYPEYWWFVWPALGWGLSVIFYGLRCFDMSPFFNAAWEKRQVEKHLGRNL